MHKGTVGASNLNTELQEALNPVEDGVTRGNWNFRNNDKVMRIKNDYDKGGFDLVLYVPTLITTIHRIQ